MKRMYIIGALLLAVCGNLGYSQATIKLKTVALGDFEYMGNPALSNDFKVFRTMLQGCLVKSKRFQLVERAKMEQALKEQGLSETGIIGSNAKKLGSLVGADYTVYGSITDVRKTAASGYVITIDLSILDNNTGEVKLADDVEVTGYGTIKQVMRTSVETLSRKITLGIYPITVAANKNGVLILNYGEGYVKEGSILDVFSQGDAIIDPATGLVLANAEEMIGQIKVKSVLKNFSKASIAHADGAITTGVICRLSKVKPAKSGHPELGVAALGSAKTQGKLKVAVGQFVYSSELDLRQTTDRTRSVSTSAATKGGGLLGGVGKLLVGEVYKSPTAGQPKPAPRAGQDRTEHSKKSDTLREMVVTRLVKTGQFDVLERSRMHEINSEIDMISSGGKGLFDKEQLSKVRLQGADYLVHGTITRLSEDIHNTTKILQNKNTVMLDMTLEIRIVDLKTGSIIAADAMSTSVETTKASAGFLGILGTANEQKGGMGDLLSDCAFGVVSKMVTSLRPIVVIDVNHDTGEVMVNYGVGIIDDGRLYEVFSQGKQIRDPHTGLVLGNAETTVGVMTPVRIDNRFSKLKLVKSDGVSGVITVGMICRPKANASFRDNTTSRKYRTRSEGKDKPVRAKF